MTRTSAQAGPGSSEPGPARASIWFVSAAWKRYETTRLTLEQRKQLCAELAADGFDAHSVVVADDDNLDLAAAHGFDTVEMPNDDVGAKYNAGFAHALERGADFVVYCGTDNWIHRDITKRLPGPREIVAGTLIQVVNLETGELRLCRFPRSYGVIPWIIPAAQLRNVQIQPGLQRGFDTALVRAITRRTGWPPSFVKTDAHEDVRVDFKTSFSLSSYDGVTANCGIGERQAAWDVLADRYGEDLAQLIIRAHQEITG